MRTVRLVPHLLASVAVLACDGGTIEPEQPANSVPVAEGDLPWIQLRAGGEAGWFDASSRFSDPDGDPLVFEAVPRNPAVVSAVAEGSRITVSPVGEGRTMVVVSAGDPGGSSAQASFRASVRRGVPGSFDIDLVLAGDPVTDTQEAAFVRAMNYWMSVLADTELPDIALDDATRLGCGEDTAEQRMSTVDDLVIVANVRQTNRPGVAFGGVCRVHQNTGLPFMGRILVSAEALNNVEDWADAASSSGLELLENLILHEIGHVLGIGTLWDDFIGGSSSDDPHFTGALAVAAFDSAGGTSYTGAKVPVEERVEAHWRREVFDGAGQAEIMTPVLTIGASISAITIQSLADLGYTVDVSLAQPYRLPGVDLVTAVAGRARAAVSVNGTSAPVYRFGDDIMRGPLLAADAHGNVVRVIPRQ